jgi:hypothetical protein
MDARCSLKTCCAREKTRVAEKQAAADREKRDYYRSVPFSVKIQTETPPKLSAACSHYMFLARNRKSPCDQNGNVLAIRTVNEALHVNTASGAP